MAQRDPGTVAKKWSDNLSNAANNGTLAAGIAAVTTSPGQAAARQKAAWLQNTTSAADRWASNTAAVTLQSWQEAATTKGVQRVATGATAAEPKMTAVMGKLLPFLNTTRGNLPARGNFQANLQRANAMATALHNAKGQFKA